MPGTARREHLLAAALELVAERDVDGLTLDALAERAGVSRALLYKHFDNRGVLLAALYEWTSTTLHEQLAGAVSQAPDVIEMFRSLL